MHLSPYANKADLLQRLRKIEGQVRGIERMIDEERYCVDILVQIAAVRAALDRVSLQLLEAHVEGCVSDAIRSGEGEPYIRELMSVVTRFVR
ncbi:MAG: metal-sensitive transcriptional regulator [Bacillota bacterium]|nr:metal-sensitive transcriptional regulator [Bacillota bacterium]